MNARTGIRSPGRRATAKALAPKFGWKGKVYQMKGNVPSWAEEDREFWLLFQEWKKSGGRLDSKECKAMSLRFLVLEAKQKTSEDIWGDLKSELPPGSDWFLGNHIGKVFGNG